MQLWLTAVDPASRIPVELRVRAPAGCTVAELRPHLVRVMPGTFAGRNGPPDLYVDAARLGDDHRLGTPPLVDGALIRFEAPAADAPRRLGILQLAVTGGPDSGRSFPLGLGRHTVGRSAAAGIRIEDPDLSRAHLTIEVGAGPTRVTDLRTTNGTRLDGLPLTGSARPWSVHGRLRAGNSTLELRSSGLSSAATTFDGEGHISVNRQPRHLPQSSDVEVRLPSPPGERHRGRLPLLAILVPLALAGPMAWLQRAPAYLLFGLMSPAMMLGGFVSDRRGGRRDERRRRARWQEDSATAQAELAGALTAEAARRRSALPDPAELLEAATVPLARLWERRRGDHDFLAVRVGLGRVPADVRVVDPDPATEQPAIDDVPIGLSLNEIGVLGLAGPRPAVTALARCLVAQVAGWHSPRDVSLMILALGGGDRVDQADWTWAARLPHTRPEFLEGGQAWVGLQQPEQLRQRVAELTAVLDERLAARGHSSSTTWPGPHVVVVLDGARTLRQLPGLARVLELGSGVGIEALCLDAERNLLPTECTAIIELSRNIAGPAVTIRDRRGAMSELVVDAVSQGWADRFGRAMAPLRDATPEAAGAGVPERARLVDLLDIDPADPIALASRWRVAPRSAIATLGATADAPYAIDLRHDGPHILIGGTTGSGKSELLQTLIASLAIANSPEHLGFVLVDYKGGSAFDACAELPHTLGLVTDLDPHLTARALTSLDAELTRRETLLRGLGARDLDDYARLVGPAGPPLSRLVLVIDEFRMLSEELPAFLDGLVRIGAVGRSLGVHLVLATQRPAGVVSADIAANVNLRIALRVRDQADSEDVIESRAAAAISPRTPGRALARSASNPLVLFQTARVAGTATDDPQALHVEQLTVDQLGESQAMATVFEPPSPSTDLSSIVRAAQTAARDLALPASPRPWLPPLPEVVTLGQLATASVGSRAPYAVVDRPDRQAQETLAWDLDHDTHLVIAGTLRSGRSSCLRTLAGSLATRFGPESVHVHAIDGGAGSLRPIAGLPNCGVVAAGDDIARGVLLLDRLAAEVAMRQSALSAAGFGSLAEQRAEVERAERLPYLVLLLDGWESLAVAWEQIEHGRPIETLMQLMRDGAAVGLRVALTGDRTLLMSRLAALVRDKIVLRLADPSDLVLAGVPTAAVPHHLPPGRGVRVTDHAEVQIALLSEDGSGTGQAQALERIAAQAEATMSTEEADSARVPLRIEPLPRQVGYAEAARVHRPPPGWALVGVGGDAGAPLGLAVGGTSAIVAGPPRSGRSTALATMARWLAERGAEVIAVTADRGEPAGRLSGGGLLQMVDPADAGRLRDLLARRVAPCLLVDDAERIMDTETEDVVLQWFKGPMFGSGSLIVAGSSAEMTVAFRGLSVVARRSGQGILLNPTAYSDGELLGVRTPPGADGSRHPGRGLLVQDGRCTPIQVAR